MIKKILLTAVLFNIAVALTSAQVYDVVSVGAGYTNQSFYSLNNDEVSNVSNIDWDLAFQIAGFQATILVNGKNNVRLFKSDLDVNSWSNISAMDTIGKLDPAHELFNQDTSWWAGAFNITNDASNMFDLGWGVYDFATHVVTGDSLYFVKLSSGIVKKIWIQALSNNTYFFAYADIDGSNEVNATLNKQDYTARNFGYYSIENNVELNREPDKYTWDLTFMQYMATTPFVYKVTGVLANDSVTAVKAYPVDESTVTPWGYTFSSFINTIGYDWKSFDFNNNIWSISDSTVYFVNDRNGGLWKIIFTGFGGAANGDYEFTKEQISATGLQENGGQPSLVGIYPNPFQGVSSLVIYIHKYDAQNTVSIFDAGGRKVSDLDLPFSEGLINLPLNLTGIDNGVYYIQSIVDGLPTALKMIVTK